MRVTHSPAPSAELHDVYVVETSSRVCTVVETLGDDVLYACVVSRNDARHILRALYRERTPAELSAGARELLPDALDERTRPDALDIAR